MEQEYATLLTPAWNHAVVQLPGRRFPGVVFQGDSLFLLLEQVREVREALDAGQPAPGGADGRDRFGAERT